MVTPAPVTVTETVPVTVPEIGRSVTVRPIGCATGWSVIGTVKLVPLFNVSAGSRPAPMSTVPSPICTS